jgi:hypothetical protein
MDTETLQMDPEESAMRELGQQTDQEQGRDTDSSAETAEPRAPAEAETEQPQETQPPEIERPEQKPDSSETETKPEPQAKQRDPVTGKFQKPETEYSRAQKEEIRKDRTWQRIQAEKEQIRTERFQWEEQRRMEELEAKRAAYQPLRQDGLTAQEYYEGAKRFEADGDSDNALKAYKIASEMGRAEYARFQEMQGVEAEYQWRVGMQQAGQQYPDLWNPDNPQGGHLTRIIDQESDWLYAHPRGQGFKLAAEVADMLVKMDSLSGLQDENEQLRAELEKYRRKGQPAKGGFAAPRLGEKDFDEMDLNEMESHLRGLTAEADNYR